MSNMNKVVFIGNNEQNHRVFCRIRIKDGNLSITGVEAPLSNGDCRGSAGQIVTNYKEASSHIVSYAKGWNEVMFKRFIDIWDEWHLNDMDSACEHVDPTAYNKKLEVERFGWSMQYYDLRQKVANSEHPEEIAEDAHLLARLNAIFARVGITGCETHGRHTWDAEIKQAFEDGWFELRETTVKPASQVYPEEHPEGYLTRECPVCGYKQGTKWLKRELPVDVIEFLASLPESAVAPAWV